MEETKCLKPSDSGSRIGDRARVQAATRVHAEQASHDEGLVKGSHHGTSKGLQLLRYPRSKPICATRPVSEHGQPHMRSPLMQLHQDPAFGGQGSGRREPFSKAAFQAMACYGSSTWIRQD